MQIFGFLRPLSRGVNSRSGYVCLQCRQRTGAVLGSLKTLPASHITHRNASTSGDKAGYFSAEKFRRRIWGTDNPPGQADPYTKETDLDKTRRETKEGEGLTQTGQESRILSPEVDYVPAATWDGLEQIGGATGWWEEAWDEEHQFKGFMPATALKSNDEIKKAIYQAVIETYPLKRRGNRTGAASHTTAMLSNEASNEVAVEAEDSDATYTSKIIESSQSGSIDFAGDSWLNIPLQDPVVKFAVLKRAMQLTGKWIPDSKISKIGFVRNIVDHFTEAPRPKKLAKELLTKPVATMPNVEIFDRRYTPIDKEKEVGRWKVIERELRKRDLPVTGKT